MKYEVTKAELELAATFVHDELCRLDLPDITRRVYNTVYAVLKQETPTSPVFEKYSAAECPRCSAELSTHLGGGFYRHYDTLERCMECGQRLAWPEEL